MKDYTKYDFAAIVGAEVELQVKFFGCYKGKVLCRWEYQGKPYLTILVCKPEGSHLSDLPVDEFVPGSLSAKIKVEDMSVKQLKRFAKIQGELSGILDVVIRFKEKRIEIFAGWDEKRCVHLFSEQHGLDDYIDCTDWGWKHE